MSASENMATKEDLKTFKEAIVHEFHVVSEGLMDHIKLLAEGHTRVVGRLDRIETGVAELRLENERQHAETRALVKLPFSELDRRVSTLESQVKDLQEWRKQIEARTA
jgi:hypothetical protein